MHKAFLSRFATQLGQADLHIMQDHRLTPARLRIESLAGLTVALFLLSLIPFAAPFIEQIPLVSLVGVMFMVVIGTVAWNSLTILRKVPLTKAGHLMVDSDDDPDYEIDVDYGVKTGVLGARH